MRNQQPENLVDLANARLKLQSRKGNAPASLNRELEEINLLLDKGLSVEARARLNNLISAARNHPVVLAGARLALSCAFEMNGDYPMSLQTIAMYEADDATDRLPRDLEQLLSYRLLLAICLMKRAAQLFMQLWRGFIEALVKAPLPATIRDEHLNSTGKPAIGAAWRRRTSVSPWPTTWRVIMNPR